MSDDQSGLGDQAEYLESSGDRLAPAPLGDRAPRRRAGLVAGGLGAAALLIGGGTWAVMAFLSQGAQPAEALPASTVAYAAVDLDPSGGQKIAAITTLRKFPAFRDRINLQTTDDLKQKLYEEIQGSAGCTNLTYESDVKPWLGDRLAVAAVDLGADSPDPVLVLQVTDATKAGAGLTKIRNCADTGDANRAAGAPHGGWVVKDGWAVVAETAATAQAVSAATAAQSLSADATYQKWVGAAGDPGIATVYLAPAAGRYAARTVEGLLGFGQAVAAFSAAPMSGATPSTMTDAANNTGPTTASDNGCDPAGSPGTLFKDFRGAAAVLRFSGGALELQGASAAGADLSGLGLGSTDHAGALVEQLPADTGAALGFSLPTGWLSRQLDQLVASSCGSIQRSGLEQQLLDATGLSVADVESLTQGGLALSLSSSVDAEQAANSSSPADLPLAISLEGDPARVEPLLAKVNAKLADQGWTLRMASTDGRVFLGADQRYLDQLTTAGGLGDAGAFQRAVPDGGNAGGVIYLNLTAGDDWFTRAMQGLLGNDPSITDNLRPLEAVGLEARTDGDTATGRLRVSTR